MKPLRAFPLFAATILAWMTICALIACGSHGAGETSANVSGETSAFEAGRAVPDLDEIVASGELIIATLSGPDTYYDYHGVPMGRE